MEFNCGTLDESHIGKTVTLHGWCRYLRDHGGKLFIDIADMHGSTQLVFEKEAKKKADRLGKEFVISATGTVEKRESDTIDSTNPTGKVDLYVKSFEVISESAVPPFELIEEKEKFLANEELRLRYRYLDLRRRSMINNVIFRDRITKAVRKFFWENDFLELETPYLVRDNYETGSRTLDSAVKDRQGQVLRPGPIAADIQADTDGLGIRQVLPDSEMLQGRGSKGGQAA